MKEDIFRKKSLDKVKSPENMDDYIQVANPGVWLLLISVLLLLAGAIIWGIFGHVDSTAATTVRVENGAAVCYIPDERVSSVQEGMTVQFGDGEAVISQVEMDGQDYVGILETDVSATDGIYEGKIVLQSVRPMSFIVN